MAAKRTKKEDRACCPGCQRLQKIAKSNLKQSDKCHVCATPLMFSEEEAKAHRLTDEEVMKMFAGFRRGRRQRVWIKLFVLLAAIGLMVISVPTDQVIFMLVGFFSFAGAVFSFFIVSDGGQKEVFAKNVVLDSLCDVFEDCTYLPEKFIDDDLLREANLINSWDRASGSDLVKGTYRGYNMRFCDLHLQDEEETTDSDGDTSTYYVTRFRGQWIFLRQIDKYQHY